MDRLERGTSVRNATAPRNSTSTINIEPDIAGAVSATVVKEHTPPSANSSAKPQGAFPPTRITFPKLPGCSAVTVIDWVDVAPGASVPVQSTPTTPPPPKEAGVQLRPASVEGADREDGEKAALV